MALAAGSQLGPYEIQSAMGGGTGEVYRARDTRLDRTVVIKLLPPYWSGHPDLKQRFEAEAKIIAGLQPPHICTLHDIGRERPLGTQSASGQPPLVEGEPSSGGLVESNTEDGIDFLVLEHLEGETRRRRMAPVRPLRQPSPRKWCEPLQSILPTAAATTTYSVFPDGKAAYSRLDVVGRSSRSTTRPVLATISGSASTSSEVVWKFTMQARST
jgi:serine/threonine protein kinase